MAAGTGGTKGQAIIKCFQEHPDGIDRKDVAELVGCTVARVGEVVRSRADEFEKIKDGRWALKGARRRGTLKATGHRTSGGKGVKTS